MRTSISLVKGLLMHRKFLKVVALSCFVTGLAACGGDSDNDADNNSEPKSYEEFVSFYEKHDFPATGDSLDGVWVVVEKAETSSTFWTEEGDTYSSVENKMIVGVYAIKESESGDALYYQSCAKEPEESSYFDFSVVFNEAGERESLVDDSSGIAFADFSSPTQITFVEEETSADDEPIGGYFYTRMAKWNSSWIKISDAYKESIGSITLDGETHNSACFSFERVYRDEAGVEDTESFSYEQEFVGVMFNETDFIKGVIYDTVSGSGDYDDYFEAEINVYNPSEFIDPAGSDGEAGFLTLINAGAINFSGESDLKLDDGREMNIKFDFNLE